jgi:hypothetical protein
VTLLLAFPCSQLGYWVAELLLFTSSDCCRGPYIGAHRASVSVAWGCVMEIEIGPEAYIALGITILGAATLVVWMIWQLISSVRGVEHYLRKFPWVPSVRDG